MTTPTLNPTAQARADELLSLMTVEEKAGLLFHAMASVGPSGKVLGADDGPGIGGPTRQLIAAGISHFALMGPASPEDIARWHNEAQDIAKQNRLSVPITVSSDPRHGFFSNPATGAAASGFSQWPEHLGLGAVRDVNLVREHADIVRRELTAVGIRVALGPTLDVASDPRWARTLGTFGADPEVVSTLSRAYIEGLRGTSPAEEVAAMIKHFPGGGAQKDGEDPHFPYGREQVWPGDRFRDHLQPFVDALDLGVTQIMPYYGMPVGLHLNGKPVEEVGFAFNGQIINELLRDQLGFDGIVCTDFTLVTDGHVFGAPMLARAWGLEHLNREERVLAILNAGCDQLGGEASQELVVKLVTDGRLSEARLDESARRLLTEKFRLGLFDNAEVDVDAVASRVGTQPNTAKGLAAQRSSIVVTDDGESFLPLTEGISVYAEGIDPATLSRYAQVAASPSEADTALLRIEAPYEERTEGMERFFRAGSLDFKKSQLERLTTIQSQVPTIVDVFLDRPALLGQLSSRVQAVTANFGASDEALLDILFGRVERRGTLPFEISESMEQVTSRREDVSFEDETPRYSYGHGIPSPHRSPNEATQEQHS